MVTVHRAHGLRTVIFVDDHEPAHVHVIGDGEAKINLAGRGGGRTDLRHRHDAGRHSAGGGRRAMAVVRAEQAYLLTRWSEVMADRSDAEIDAALARGKLAQETEPRAASVRYDETLRRVVVDLTNGCTFAFPPGLAQGLETASEEELRQVEILGVGFGLHWEALDVDLSVPGLLAGLFGTRAYMARRAGQATSPAKAAASRANGARGGRPRKQA